MAGNTKEKPNLNKFKQNLPLIITAIVAVLALTLLGFKMMGGNKPKENADKKQGQSEVGITLPLEEFLVNLNGGNDHYLRTVVALGLKKGITEEQFKEHIAPTRDAIITVLSSQAMKDLTNAKRREALKEEVRKKVNDALGEELVAKIYFTSFATQ